ncbi:MAG: PQQ-binding-like beta-propeller repeat protein [Planctomycetota bacterium]
MISDGAGLGATAHPMFRYNRKHTALSTLTGSITDTLKWSYLTGGEVQSSPAVSAGNKIIFGSYDGNLYSLNANGSFNWSYSVGGTAHSSPAVATDGTIYTGGLTGLYALNADGSLKWFYNAGTWLKSSPVINSDGTIYIGGTNGLFYAINPDGSLKWIYTAGGWIESSPAIADNGTIYVGSFDNKLYALNPTSTLKWSFSTGGSIVSSPAVAADGTIYIGSYDGKLYAVNPDGSQKWTFNTGGQVHSSPAIAADGKIIVGSDDNQIYAVNTNGSQAWSYLAGDNVRSSAAIDSTGTIFIGSDDGKIYSLTAGGGFNWSYNTTSPVRSSPSIANIAGVITQTILVGSNTNRLYAISNDPALLQITKKANKQQVSIGDIVTYQIMVTNSGTDPSNQTLIDDRIPDGFKYVKGASRLSVQGAGTSVLSDPTGIKMLTFDIGTLAVGQTKILSYQLVVGSGVVFGAYENQAVCRYFDIQWKTSNTARETIEVIPDPLFDLGTIIGKVFYDKNGNGIQDHGEEGVKEAKIITEEGIIVITDKVGRYHIPGVKPGTHLLKLRSPTGEKSNSPTVPQSNSFQVVRVTEGLLCKVNFGITGSRTPETGNQKETASFTLIALGDGQLGYSRVKGDKQINQIADNDKRLNDGWYNQGRLAYYLDSKLPTSNGGEYRMISSFDTARINSAMRNPPSAFKYIDPDKYYLTYGDQSKISYKATNTQGPLYLLTEYKPPAGSDKPEASFLIGNYHTELDKLDLANYQRTLYGAKAEVRSEKLDVGKNSNLQSLTSNIKIFTAAAYQLAAHNEFRGTGGSFYYLKHTNLIEGSEKIRIEVRDKTTNRPLKNINKSRGQDYEIDYSNGRIIFKQPVSSVDLFPDEQTDRSLITSTDILDGHHIYVVVDYEYKPDRRHWNKGTFGGQAGYDFSKWFNSTSPMQVGLTYVQEENADKKYELKGIDSSFQVVPGSKLYFEYAESVSLGIPNYLSYNGGLNFNQITSGLNPSGSGWSVKTNNQLTQKVRLDGYYKELEPGFISSNTITEQGTKKYGASITAQVHPKITLAALSDIQKLDDTANQAAQHYAGGNQTTSSILQGKYLENRWGLTTEYRHQTVHQPISGINSAGNFDTDVAAARFDYKLTGAIKTFLQQQATLKGEPNHQSTAGASVGLLDIASAKAQSTVGTKGNSGLVSVESNFKQSVVNIFSSYQIDNPINEGKSSVFTVGNALQPDKTLRLYSQQEFRVNQNTSSEGTVLGLDKKLLERWQIGGSFEKGRVNDLNNNRTNRYVASGSVTYDNKDKLRISSKLEIRFDEGRPVERDQYLIYNSMKYYLNQDITLAGRLNLGKSINQTMDTTEGLFGEYGLSVGYRPVSFDRLNLLAKYTYLADTIPDEQFNAAAGLAQEHTFISKQRFKVSALEAAYDLTNHFQLVEKYAFKNGREKVGNRDYTESDTNLWINRLNYHFASSTNRLHRRKETTDQGNLSAEGMEWWQRIDLGIEYRILTQSASGGADDRKKGFLVETLYELNEEIRLGIGYNFTDFSDDLLSNNDYSVRGPFIRLVATVVY